MKINKKVAKWTIQVVVFLVGVFLVACIIEPTIDIVYKIARGLPYYLIEAICILVVLAVSAIVAALVITIIFMIEFGSDARRTEFANQLEAREAREARDRSRRIVVVSDHGDSLEEVMEAIRRERWEYNALFSLSGKKLAEGTFQSSESCNIAAEDWQKLDERGENVIDLHNHPGNSNSAFSHGDFAAFLCRDYIEQFIVVTKKYNYILMKTGGSYESLKDEAKKYAAEIFMKYLWLGYLSNRLWTILVSKKTAEKFGLEFRVERVPQATARRNRARIGLAACAMVILCLTLTGSQVTTESFSISSAPAATTITTPFIWDNIDVVYVFDDAYICEGSVSLEICNPANDPYVQDHAPIGGGSD